MSEEIPLDAFNLLDARVSYAFAMRSAVVQGVEVFLNGSNLLDEDARPHNSPLKYIAPLPGRGFSGRDREALTTDPRRWRPGAFNH